MPQLGLAMEPATQIGVFDWESNQHPFCCRQTLTTEHTGQGETISLPMRRAKLGDAYKVEYGLALSTPNSERL